MKISPRFSQAGAGLSTHVVRLVKDRAARASLQHRVSRRIERDLSALRARRGRMSLPEFPIPPGPIARPHLRVAVILDPFSSLAFKFEWDQDPVPRQGWQEHLKARTPDMLFVESAWAGNERQWRLAMTQPEGPGQDLVDLVRWCRAHRIPTVFWNKEDPPNYEIFVSTAALFDHVFTVDADRISAYRHDLGHERIALLPFAAQPRIHSPVRTGRQTRGEVAFAGTYFAHKHPARQLQMEVLLPAAKKRGLHIFSRMVAEDSRYRFPRQYRSAVVGSLTYPQMLAAATEYPVFLNVNSVTDSPTMCARRLFELSAAATTVLSTPSAAITPFFGETITVVEDRAGAESALKVLLDQPEHRERLAWLAHRRVFDEHLYTHRVDTILKTVGIPMSPSERSISAIVPTMRPNQIDHVLLTMAGQVHSDLELVLVTHGFEVDQKEVQRRAGAGGDFSLVVRSAPADVTLGGCMNLGVQAASGQFVAKMDDDNTYGAHYLSDLVRAFDYSDASVAGKWAHYVHLAATDATLLRFASSEHRYVKLVQGGTILTHRSLANDVQFEDLPRRVDTTFLEKVRRDGGKVYSADRFNFISRRAASTAGHTWGITDQEILTRSSHLQFYGDPVDHVRL